MERPQEFQTILHKIINNAPDLDIRIIITKNGTDPETVNVKPTKTKTVDLALTPNHTLSVFRGGKKIFEYQPSGRSEAVSFIMRDEQGNPAVFRVAKPLQSTVAAEVAHTLININRQQRPENSVVVKSINNLSLRDVIILANQEIYQIQPTNELKLNLVVNSDRTMKFITTDSARKERTTNYKPSGLTGALNITIDTDGAVYIAEATAKDKGKKIQFAV